MTIKLYMRHLQILNLVGQPIVYVGSTPQTLVTQLGSVPVTSWQDYTEYVENIDTLRFAWSQQINEDGEVSTGAFQNKNTTTGQLVMVGAAHTFLKDWLVDNVAATLNAIEVKVVIEGCGEFLHWKIGADQVEWAENEVCQFAVTLKQVDEAYRCIQKTEIADNWQGWFQTVPANGKKHPRFSYCNEARPNAQLVMTWYLIGVLASSTLSIMIPLILAINSIIFLINGIIIVINAIIWIINQIANILGTNTQNPVNSVGLINFVDPMDYINGFVQFYVESAGCGREHPAPLVRDYILNVCQKCGIDVGGGSAAIFFNPMITLTLSSDPTTPITTSNPHYNACYFHAPVKRGIRRYKDINVWSGLGDMNLTDYWIDENKPLLTGDMFFDKLKKLYNCDWDIKNGVLRFMRKDLFLQNSGYVYDFSANGNDRGRILQGVNFSWDGEQKQPASCKGLYSLDAVDTCGNEAQTQMNDYVSFGMYDNNPNFDGIMDKETQFGAAKFRMDGASTDYICDAMQVVVNGQILQPWTIGQMNTVANFLQEYADYCLLLKDETCTIPKILLWDGVSFNNAKCIRDVVPMSTSQVSGPVPDINYNYPITWDSFGNPVHQPWDMRHSPETFVKGSTLSLASFPIGMYSVKDYTGIAVLVSQPARVVNFPMSFEAHYKATMWDWFHWIDDPRRNPSLRQKWSVLIDLCCEDLGDNRLGVLNGAENIKLHEKVKLDRAFYPDGIINQIEVVLDSKDEYGKHIVIKGSA